MEPVYNGMHVAPVAGRGSPVHIRFGVGRELGIEPRTVDRALRLLALERPHLPLQYRDFSDTDATVALQA